ncbi:MAG: MFS transporter [Candidatus Vogelbacteria bacterium]|nr:MFS transporter [Candidatus Vogelbacteria bacterium]
MPVARVRLFTYVAGFAVAVATALPAYVNSSFLATVVSDQKVGLVYTLASITAIIALAITPTLIKWFGNIAITTGVASLTLLSLVLLSSAPSIKWWALGLFGFYYAAMFVLRFTLDLYLEHLSTDERTGEIRGLFLTIINVAWLLSPLVAGVMITAWGFSSLYFLAALMLVPLLYVAGHYLSRAEAKPKYLGRSQLSVIIGLLTRTDIKTSNLRRILVIDLLLNFFYAVMVIYSPLYLIQTIGLSWSELGVVFTIMLLPFVLFEYPLGRLADRWIGEKEILATGLVIAGLSTLFIPLVATKSLVIWSALLFMTRVGASAIEAMKEIYLFKKIDSNDTSIVSLSRDAIPLSYIIAPLAVSTFLVYFLLSHIFYALGLLMFIGLIPTYRLQDTK